MPSGLEGPSLSFLFKLFYLQLLHFRDRKILQSINEPLSVNAPTVQRSQLGQPVTASLQDEDAYITVDRSELVGRHIVEQLAKGDSIPVLDIVQRHHKVSFYLGDITDEQGMLDILKKSGITYIVQNALLPQGAKDLSIYVKINIEGTRAVISVAIAASVHRLVHTSSTSITFDGTDVMNVDERVPYPEKLFDAYNDAQEVSGTRDSPTEGGLIPRPSYSSATSSEPLHCALPPICATTEYHCGLCSSAQPLSPYVTPPPNAESILSAFNTPFDPHELGHPAIHSRSNGQAFFIAIRGLSYILDFTGVYDEYEQRLSSPEVQGVYK
ncbi:hypothetical protein BKA82DRAFT_4349697 [Pisolithus tinctorius]|nr:hypothetical protein BKA82DRAFT_4349697 [Pisolithus tinctorius]